LVKDDLPFWKIEGYAEYISYYKENYVESGDFRENALTYLNSEGYFLTNEQGTPRPLPYFKSRTLVEYLLIIKGITFEQLKSDEITEEETINDLRVWSGDL